MSIQERCDMDETLMTEREIRAELARAESRWGMRFAKRNNIGAAVAVILVCLWAVHVIVSH